jgi:hypothetical protein
VTKAKPFVKAQSWRRVNATSRELDSSFLVGLRQWVGGRAAMAASSWARSSAVTVSPADSAKIGSIIESIESMLITIYIGSGNNIYIHRTATLE